MAHDTTSRIGRGTIIRGSIRGEGDVEIEGRVEGVVEIDGEVSLAESGRVKIQSGALTGSRVSVRGAVAGDLRATGSIVLEAGARVVGDLAAPSIGIRPGGLLRGHVSTSEEPSAAPRASRADTRRQEAPAARAAAQKAPAQKPAVRPPPPRRAPAAAPAFVEEAPAPARARGRAAAPPPVMPALKKGAKAQMKKKVGK
jgi:cytoskeletal protein CcmA (bactofilin family)